MPRSAQSLKASTSSAGPPAALPEEWGTITIFAGADGLAEALPEDGRAITELPFTVGGLDGVDNLFDLFDVTLALLEEVHDQY